VLCRCRHDSRSAATRGGRLSRQLIFERETRRGRGSRGVPFRPPRICCCRALFAPHPLLWSRKPPLRMHSDGWRKAKAKAKAKGERLDYGRRAFFGSVSCSWLAHWRRMVVDRSHSHDRLTNPNPPRNEADGHPTRLSVSSVRLSSLSVSPLSKASQALLFLLFVLRPLWTEPSAVTDARRHVNPPPLHRHPDTPPPPSP
jgi:hypothetical protein